MIGQGRENVRNFLKENPDIANHIEAQIRAIDGVQGAISPLTALEWTQALVTPRDESGELLVDQDGNPLVEVTEGPARLWVNLHDYLDTGLFLDHRPTRMLIGELARGRHFLNLFCYTGAATVHAALGGAASTTSLDLSATYLDWAGRNLALNGIASTGLSGIFFQRPAPVTGAGLSSHS